MSELVDGSRSLSPMGMRDDETYSSETTAKDQANDIARIGETCDALDGIPQTPPGVSGNDGSGLESITEPEEAPYSLDVATIVSAVDVCDASFIPRAFYEAIDHWKGCNTNVAMKALFSPELQLLSQKHLKNF